MIGVDEFAIQFITIVLYVFVAIFVCLIGFVLVHRYLLNKWDERIEASGNDILPHLYSYIDGDLTRREFADLLTDKFYIAASFRNIRLMIDDLAGEQQIRLKSLLDIPAYKKYFLKKLRSNRKISVAQACIYFEKKNLTDRSVIERLKELQKDNFSVISYSATLALINTTAQEVRDQALIEFLKRDKISRMSVSDVIYEYYYTHPDKRKAGTVLIDMVLAPSIPADHSVPIVHLLPEFGFYDLVDNLYELFSKLLPHDSTGRLTSAIIDVVGEFSTHNIGPLLVQNQLWLSEFQPVRLAVVSWMKGNFSSEYENQLLTLAEDSDLEVRIAAQTALLQFSSEVEVDWDIDPSSLSEYHIIKKKEALDVSFS